MNYIDILSMLKLHKGTLKNVKVYGYTGDILERPSNIFSSVTVEEGCSFRVFKVYAIDLSEYADELGVMGVSAEKSTFFVNGSVCVLTRDLQNYPDWYKIEGDLRFGSKVSNNYVTMLDYTKKDGKWHIAENKLLDFEASDEFGTELKSVAFGEELLPDEVKQLPPIRATQSIADLVDTKEGELPLEQNAVFQRERGNFRAVDRTELGDFSKNYGIFKGVLDEAESQLEKMISDLEKEYPLQYDYEELTELLEKLHNNMKHKATSNCMTGRTIINKYLSEFGRKAAFSYQGVSIKKFITENFELIEDYVQRSRTAMFTGRAYDLVKMAFSKKENLYAGLLGAITGISLGSACKLCTDHDISFIKVVNSNPYILFVLGVLNFTDADYLANVFGVSESVNTIRYKYVCVLHEYIENSDTSSTAYKTNELKRLNVRLRTISKVVQETSQVFLMKDGRLVSERTTNITMPSYAFDQTIKDYTSLGLGVWVNGYLTSVNLLRKELFIYETLYNIATRKFPYKTEDVDLYIDEYEESIGFKLEIQQRKAVHIIVHGSGCITGQAGSGKTTVVGCILYVLERLEGDIQVRFGTPTGKAAKVLQGVVKNEVRTLHSLCRINPDEAETIWKVDENEVTVSDSVYIFDELSMVNLNLLYTVLNRLDSSRFYFVGDINQLKAIGKGLVFRNLLSFLPTVVLNVSKRSTENSGINFNGDVICNHSRQGDWKELKETDDFRIIQCENDDIPTIVEDVCSFYLGKNTINALSLPMLENVTQDDIQVISPFVRESYEWGSKKLNRRLQPLFNKARGYEDVVYVGDLMLNIGDRVIHTSKNTYSMQWYSSFEGGIFQKIYGCGVANGEVGTFKGIIPVSEARFFDEIEKCPNGFSYYDSLRDDFTFDMLDGYFIVVEYFDVSSGRPYYILYRSLLRENRLIGFDTTLLDLFYAGSTHKLEGSQSRIAICCFGSVEFGGFLTRNMLYTMITRGRDLVILVGSMAQVQRSRCLFDTEGALTIGQLLLKG